jgi:pilus assembly protein CpaE
MNHPAQETNKQLRVVAICLDSASLAALQDVLARVPDAEFNGNFPQYLGRKSDLDLIRRMTSPAPDIIILDFDQDRERAAATAEQLHEVLEGKASIFAISAHADPEFIIHAMRSGCSEYLGKPVPRDRLNEAIAKADSKRRDRGRLQRTGKVITLLGAKGGAGVTVLAVHLAAFLSMMRKGKTLLIDYHPGLGDVALYLGIDKHVYNFYELVNNTARLDVNLVQGFVVSHQSGVDVLPSPSTFDLVTSISEKDAEYTIGFLKTIYDYIVIDCAPGLAEANLAAVQQSDEMCLVATPDVPSIRNLSRYLEHLTRFNHPAENVKVVINRYSKKGDISKDHIEKILKKQVYLTVPNSYAEVIEAINSGTPIAADKRLEFVQALRHWVESLTQGVPVPAIRQEPPKRFGILKLVTL